MSVPSIAEAGLKTASWPTEPTPPARRRRRLSTRSRSVILVTQIVVLVVVMLIWQYVPQIGNLSKLKFLDPYFISSPTLVWQSLVDLLFGQNGVPSVWQFLWPTFVASVLGLIIAMVVGGVLGLVLGSFQFLGAVFRPFVVAFNAVPRIALIPIVVVFFGSGLVSSVVVAFLVVLFVALFNAYEGASTVDVPTRQNAQLLGASGWDIMWRIRFPYALAWTLSSLPVAVSFSIVSVVTGEILTGSSGMGLLITTATNASDTSMVFAVVIVLSVVALALLWVADRFKRRVLHWWIQSE